MGAYGDYSYNKSTLDKYKDAKNDKPSANEYKKEEKKPEVQVETKKPFEKVASKLSKPGEKKEVEEVKVVQQTTIASTPASTNNGSIIDIFEISAPAVTVQPTQPFSFEAPKPAVQTVQPVQPPPQVQQVPQPQPVQTYQPQPAQTFQPAPVAPVAPQTYAPQPQVPGYQNPYVQPQPQQFPQYPQPQYPYNQYQQPNPYQQPQFNQFQQNPYNPQPNQFAYQQPYNPVPQPYNPYSAPPQTSPYSATANLSAGITLNPTNTKK